MSTLLERGIRMAARALPESAGGAVTLSRGATTGATPNAAFGQTQFQVEVNGSVRVETSDRDFIIAAADYVIGSATTPARGDRITSGSEVYEVLAPGGADVYRKCDPQGIVLRIHTKRLS